MPCSCWPICWRHSLFRTPTDASSTATRFSTDSYLRSLAIDRDVDFSNDTLNYIYPRSDDGSPNVWLTRKTPTGRPVNMMSIGPGILWSPFFAAAFLFAILARALGINLPLDGYSLPFVLSAGVAGVVYATLGAHFCYRSCRLVFDSRPAFWATITAWLATPAVYYSVISPAYSHAPSFFAMSLFVYVWLETRHRDDVARYVVLGLLAGLATLVRWQDAIILILPGFQLVSAIATRRLSLPAAVPRGIVLAAGVAVMLLPQFLAWRSIYGEFFVLPQGEGFMRWTDPAIAAVLFSLRHGLFSWTPAVLLSIAGLAWLVRRDALLGWASVAVLAVAVYVNASVSDWWAGAAFGARRFVGYTVFFALGFAAAFSSGHVASSRLARASCRRRARPLQPAVRAAVSGVHARLRGTGSLPDHGEAGARRSASFAVADTSRVARWIVDSTPQTLRPRYNPDRERVTQVRTPHRDKTGTATRSRG